MDRVQAIGDETSPSLSPHLYSSDLVDFVDLCLRKDPDRRGTSESLLVHPFILRTAHDPLEARAAVASCLPEVDVGKARR